MATAMQIAKRGLILKTEVGSRVTGINEFGDHDHMGICLEPPQTVVGLHKFEQYQYRDAAPGERSQPDGLDLTVYSLRKWARLAVAGNPTVLTPLYAPKEHVVFSNRMGEELRDNAYRFISKDAGPRFIGYMQSQLGPLRGEKKHTNRPELIEKYGYDTKFASHAIRLGIQGLEIALDGCLTLPIREPELSNLRAIRQGESTAKDVLMQAEILLMELKVAFEDCALPEHADAAWINNFLYRAHRQYWDEAAEGILRV